MTGWKLVPTESTLEMVKAALDVERDAGRVVGNPEVRLGFYSAYRAQVSAAPPIPDEVIEEVARKLAATRVYEGYNTETKARLIDNQMTGAVRDVRLVFAALAEAK